MLQYMANINEKTGEITRERRKFIEETFNEEGYRVPPQKRKASMFADVPFPFGMSDAEIGKMARLSKLMISTSNMLGYRKGKGILPYTEGHLIEVLGMSQYRGTEFIRRMIDLGMMQRVRRVIGSIDSEELYINPAYFFAGRRISLNLYLLFREHLDPVLPDWVKAEFLSLANEQDKESVTKVKVSQSQTSL